MQQVKSDHPPGHVGVISGDLSRYPQFMMSMMRLLVPVGCTWNWVRGNGFAQNRNLIVQGMSKEAEWLWFIDDDHVFDRELVFRLLERRVDVVQPLVSTRKPPYFPYVYRWSDAEDAHVTVDWPELPADGLFECDAVGTGGCLIRRPVLDAIGYPWFEEGRTGPDQLGEDLWFMRKAKDHGFRVFVDTDNCMGHTTTVDVWPVVYGHVRYLDLDVQHGVRVRVQSGVGRNTPSVSLPKTEKKR